MLNVKDAHFFPLQTFAHIQFYCTIDLVWIHVSVLFKVRFIKEELFCLCVCMCVCVATAIETTFIR